MNNLTWIKSLQEADDSPGEIPGNIDVPTMRAMCVDHEKRTPYQCQHCTRSFGEIPGNIGVPTVRPVCVGRFEDHEKRTPYQCQHCTRTFEEIPGNIDVPTVRAVCVGRFERTCFKRSQKTYSLPMPTLYKKFRDSNEVEITFKIFMKERNVKNMVH